VPTARISFTSSGDCAGKGGAGGEEA